MTGKRMAEIECKFNKTMIISDADLLALRNWYYQLYSYFKNSPRFNLQGIPAMHYEELDRMAIMRLLDPAENTYKDPEV